ncbi:hypothetical protein GCM10027079_15110 [Sediminivirga luteola]|uniref:PTS system glucitol/sorbitol-specific IIA component n=2 Tax=Sediminivirga luteola TaxID=1774748 RepID=A0A8J2TVD7_9MICO|nr:hypothetical protein GCM10011333_02570 [Sediminivirga luteola]
MTTMTTYYSSTVSEVGADAADMLDGGVAIFFGTGCPPALAEVSIVHRADTELHRDPRPGDVLRVGDTAVELTRVGERAGENLRTLGHIVVYTDPEPGTSLLPGAVHATGRLAVPEPGAVILLEGE